MQFDTPRKKDGLLGLTRSLPEEAFFLESSRQRELAYIERSYGRWLEVIRLLKRWRATEGLSCLDIGCSPLTFLLTGYFKTVSALDLTSAFRKRCEAANIKFYEGGVASDESVSRIEKVDCIFFLEVLEHLHANPVDVLRRLRLLLRSGGLLVLSTPNMMCFANRINMLMNRKLRHFTYPPFSSPDTIHGFAHDRIYSPSELRDYFRSSGFTRINVLYLRHFDDTGHADLPLWRKLVAILPITIKFMAPPLRDGTIVLGFND